MANSDDRYEMLRHRELSKLSWVVKLGAASSCLLYRDPVPFFAFFKLGNLASTAAAADECPRAHPPRSAGQLGRAARATARPTAPHTKGLRVGGARRARSVWRQGPAASQRATVRGRAIYSRPAAGRRRAVLRHLPGGALGGAADGHTLRARHVDQVRLQPSAAGGGGRAPHSPGGGAQAPGDGLRPVDDLCPLRSFAEAGRPTARGRAGL